MQTDAPMNPAFLREWREACGLTQRELARRAGVGPTQISKLEKGKQRVHDGWLIRLGVALDLSPAHFFYLPGQEPIDVKLLRIRPEKRRRAAWRVLIAYIEFLET
jgi:transcriptional regulator with XRE-family HTH domain